MLRTIRSMNITNGENTMTDSVSSNGTLDLNMTVNDTQPFINTTTMASTILSTTTTAVSTAATSSSSTSATPTTTIALATTTVGNTWLGLSMSNTILIAVFTGCTALILIVLCAICCRLLCVKSRTHDTEDDRMKRQAARTQSANHYADPPRVVENHYHSNDVTRLYATPAELTYARPEIYSTFINPSLYEDVYARWKMQEQTRHDKSYDSPWQYTRRLKDQMDNTDLKWSADSLRALDAYDYDKYGRIPRGKLSSESEETNQTREETDTETVIGENPSFTTF